MRVPSPIAGEYVRLGTAVREKRMTVEQALKEIAQICIDRHEHFGLALVPLESAAEIEALRARLNWVANELLACDYGDNDKGGVGWTVFGWRDVNGIHSIVPPERTRKIYGKSIDAAIDAAIHAAALDEAKGK